MPRKHLQVLGVDMNCSESKRRAAWPSMMPAQALGAPKQRIDNNGDRRFAEECVQIARTAKSPENQAALLQMALVWFRVAQET
jgi:hypothetical protein